MRIEGATASEDVIESIRSYAAAAYPSEGCGILIGSIAGANATIVEATSARNLNVERARDRYDLDPADFIRADREARARRLDIVGFWHSHPDHPARPSATDTERAWMDYVYIVCHSERDRATDVNAFTLTGEHGPFVAIPLDSPR